MSLRVLNCDFITEFVGLRLFYTDEDEESEMDEGQLALASAAWYSNQRHNKANVSLDIGTLKRQYAKLRDRQRQAHVILTSTLKTAIEVCVFRNFFVVYHMISFNNATQ